MTTPFSEMYCDVPHERYNQLRAERQRKQEAEHFLLLHLCSAPLVAVANGWPPSFNSKWPQDVSVCA